MRVYFYQHFAGKNLEAILQNSTGCRGAENFLTGSNLYLQSEHKVGFNFPPYLVFQINEHKTQRNTCARIIFVFYEKAVLHVRYSHEAIIFCGTTLYFYQKV